MNSDSTLPVEVPETPLETPSEPEPDPAESREERKREGTFSGVQEERCAWSWGGIKRLWKPFGFGDETLAVLMNYCVWELKGAENCQDVVSHTIVFQPWHHQSTERWVTICQNMWKTSTPLVRSSVEIRETVGILLPMTFLLYGLINQSIDLDPYPLHILSIFFQRVWPSWLSTTSWIRTGIVSAYFWISSTVILSHFSIIVCFTAFLVPGGGLRRCSRFLRRFQIFSIGLRSGEDEDQSRDRIKCCSLGAFMILTECAGALSFIKIGAGPWDHILKNIICIDLSSNWFSFLLLSYY